MVYRTVSKYHISYLQYEVQVQAYCTVVILYTVHCTSMSKYTIVILYDIVICTMEWSRRTNRPNEFGSKLIADWSTLNFTRYSSPKPGV